MHHGASMACARELAAGVDLSSCAQNSQDVFRLRRAFAATRDDTFIWQRRRRALRHPLALVPQQRRARHAAHARRPCFHSALEWKEPRMERRSGCEAERSATSRCNNDAAAPCANRNALSLRTPRRPAAPPRVRTAKCATLMRGSPRVVPRRERARCSTLTAQLRRAPEICGACGDNASSSTAGDQ
jgi:hypothetical protein